MIRRQRNADADALRQRLAEAEQEKHEVVQQGVAARPMLRRLERHLADNGFAERVYAALLATRRRPT